MTSGRTPLPLVQLRAATEPGQTSRPMTATIQLKISGQPVDLAITVPAEPTRITNMLPIFQGMANVVVDLAEQKSIDEGKPISCTKGCGACCRQLVPISEMEARALTTLVEAMPEPRRTTIRERFTQAREQLLNSGLGMQTSDQVKAPKEQLRAFGLAYFDLHIACPFLEEEACSIHPDRPLSCREYLVTSPASHCTRPTAETIKMVHIPTSVAHAARLLERQVYGDQVQWMPLITALAWTSQHREEPTPQPGTALLQAFFQHLSS